MKLFKYFTVLFMNFFQTIRAGRVLGISRMICSYKDRGISFWESHHIAQEVSYTRELLLCYTLRQSVMCTSPYKQRISKNLLLKLPVYHISVLQCKIYGKHILSTNQHFCRYQLFYQHAYYSKTCGARQMDPYKSR